MTPTAKHLSMESVKNAQRELSSMPKGFVSLSTPHAELMTNLMDPVLLAMLVSSSISIEDVSRVRQPKSTPTARDSKIMFVCNVLKVPG